MQKKRNIKFRAIDLAIIVLCLAGSVFSAITFWRVYDRTLSKLTEEPVGIIVFKQRTAQRRFEDRLVWDRLKQNSPLYNGDTIRTIELSEAIITFRDEVSGLIIYENTMIRIFYNDTDGVRVEFTSGNLEVNSGTASITVTSGSSVITVEGMADFTKSEEGLGFAVLSGSAVFDGEEIESGSIIAIDQHGVRDTRPAIAMTSFGSSARIEGVQEGTTPVNFSWNESGFANDTFVIVEVALDRNFSHIVGGSEARNISEVSIPVEIGNYWWRAYPASGNSGEPANDIYPWGPLEVFVPSVQGGSSIVQTGLRAESILEWEQAVQTAAVPEEQEIDEAHPTAAQTQISAVISDTARTDTASQPTAAAGWTVNHDTASTARVTTANEIIDGQEKNVITITTNLANGSPRWAGAIFNDDSFIQKLREGSGVRFKVLGDGRSWDFIVEMTQTTGRGPHRRVLTTRNGSVTEYDIPYSQLRQPAWWEGARQTFNKNNIVNILFERNPEHAAGSSTIKIFDLEVYGDTPSVPAATPAAVQPLSATENPYISGAEWNAFSDSFSASKVNTGMETINGQQRDVLTVEINLAAGTPRWAGGSMDDSSKLSHLRNSSGVRFKVLGDGNSWGFLVYTGNVTDDAFHRYNFSTRNGEVVEIDIPFSRLRQADWGRRVSFIVNDAYGFGIQRDDNYFRAGSSAIKIYDLVLY